MYKLRSIHTDIDTTVSFIILHAGQVHMLTLSPVPGDDDYFFHMDEQEGVDELFLMDK